ncbi:hypothetical protein MGLY_35090 (plasmid) [Neomoorella glycerini]|uniref:DUF1640 domain-containing protein n=2 Tax=Neomoorella glycerini TaxID=55779 RepID=A0A6I5ZWC8_9FIRM|nr:hypothetical protein MGLY_35090 [Moorella glycerini]
MSAMPEESLREIAATNEPHHTLASPEFFFLLQRIDKLDETLTKEIKDGDQKLESRIDKLENRIDKLESRIDKLDEKFSGKLTTLNYFAAGALFTLVTGFIGVIATLLSR